MEAWMERANTVLPLPSSPSTHRHLRHRHPFPVRVVVRGLQDAGAAHRDQLQVPPLPPPRRAHRRRPLRGEG